MNQIFYPGEFQSSALQAVHPDLPPFDVNQCLTHDCDAHVAVIQNGSVTARGSLWWTRAPQLPGTQTGVIGHFAALDLPSAREFLNAACRELKHHGCSLAVGPMDGNTWRRYRFLTERGPEPPFFLEPDNPDSWPGFFEAADFTPLATYFSALNNDLSVEDPRIPRTRARLEGNGITFRTLDGNRYVEELKRIYAISRISFQSNFLYTPISEAEFLAQYEPLRAHVRPELVMFAEDAGQPIGFVFGIPDLAQAKRGHTVDTMVLKTIAVLPGRTHAGLGNVLFATCQQQARTLGYRRVIHALMHEANNSLNMSAHYAKPFRRYTLYSLSL